MPTVRWKCLCSVSLPTLSPALPNHHRSLPLFYLARTRFHQFILLASNSRRILFQEESPENLSHPRVPACSQVPAIPRGVASSFGGESRCRRTRIPLFSNGETYRWSVQNYPHSDSDYYRCPRRVQGWGTCLCHPIDTLPLRQADTSRQVFITGRPERQICSGFCLAALRPPTDVFKLHEVEHPWSTPILNFSLGHV